MFPAIQFSAFLLQYIYNANIGKYCAVILKHHFVNRENTPCGRTGAKTSAANSSNMTGSLCCLAIDSTYLALSSKLNTLLKIKASSSYSYKLILLISLSRVWWIQKLQKRIQWLVIRFKRSHHLTSIYGCGPHKPRQNLPVNNCTTEQRPEIRNL